LIARSARCVFRIGLAAALTLLGLAAGAFPFPFLSTGAATPTDTRTSSITGENRFNRFSFVNCSVMILWSIAAIVSATHVFILVLCYFVCFVLLRG
jgi:hypothetical protein